MKPLTHTQRTLAGCVVIICALAVGAVIVWEFVIAAGMVLR